jgi:DNA primase
MPSIDYHELRGRLKIQDVLQWMHWHSSEQRGDQRRGPCPLCGSTSHPSRSSKRCFSVNFDRNIFHCFHCHRGGNALDLWASHQQLSLHAAAAQLLQLLNPTSSNCENSPAQPRN